MSDHEHERGHDDVFHGHDHVRNFRITSFHLDLALQIRDDCEDVHDVRASEDVARQHQNVAN